MIPRPLEIDVIELAERRAAGDEPLVLDVREPEEFAWCRLEGSTLVPLDELPARLDELDPDEEIFLLCHTGVRSRVAAELLRARGFARAYSLAGGIQRWSLIVDPAVPTY